MKTDRHKTIAIIGAGPVGLAAAAQALERGLTPLVLETGSEVGHAVDGLAAKLIGTSNSPH